MCAVASKYPPSRRVLITKRIQNLCQYAKLRGQSRRWPKTKKKRIPENEISLSKNSVKHFMLSLKIIQCNLVLHKRFVRESLTTTIFEKSTYFNSKLSVVK